MKKVIHVLISTLLILSTILFIGNTKTQASGSLDTPSIGVLDRHVMQWELLSDQRTILVGNYNNLYFVDGKKMTELDSVPLDFNLTTLLQKDSDTIILLSTYNRLYEYSLSTGNLKLNENYTANRDAFSDVYWKKLDDNTLLEVFDNTFIVRDIHTYEVLYERSVNSEIIDYSYNINTDTLAITLQSNELLLYKLDTFDYIGQIKNEKGVYFEEVLFSDDGGTIYTTQEDNSYNTSLIAYDTETKSVLFSKTFDRKFSNLILINDRFIQGEFTGKFKVFDLNTGTFIHSFLQPPFRGNKSIYLDSLHRLVAQTNSGISFFDFREISELPNITNVNVYTSEETLYTGEKYTLNGFLEFSDGSQKEFQPGELNWHVNDFYTAHFKDGILTARDPGTFTMTSKLWGFDLSLTKTVHSFIPEDADSYIEWPAPEPVSPKKVWEVLVNQSINYENIQENDIMVTDRNGKLVPTLYVINEKNGRTSIKVVPTLPYKQDETYTLWVRHLISDKGDSLSNNVKMTFTVQ